MKFSVNLEDLKKLQFHLQQKLKSLRSWFWSVTLQEVEGGLCVLADDVRESDSWI